MVGRAFCCDLRRLLVRVRTERAAVDGVSCWTGPTGETRHRHRSCAGTASLLFSWDSFSDGPAIWQLRSGAAPSRLWCDRIRQEHLAPWIGGVSAFGLGVACRRYRPEAC